MPYLKVYNLVDQQIAFAYRPQFIDRLTHSGVLKRSIVRPKDVLMNIVGRPLGKVAIVPRRIRNGISIKPLSCFVQKAEFLSKYLYYLLCSGVPYEEVLNETRGSAGQVNISLTQCREMVFHLPCTTEQEYIVERIETGFKACAKAEKEIKRVRELLDRLWPAVSEQAFTGTLVEQDLRDERSDDVIERMKAAVAPVEKVRSKRAAGQNSKREVNAPTKEKTRSKGRQQVREAVQG